MGSNRTNPGAGFLRIFTLVFDRLFWGKRRRDKQFYTLEFDSATNTNSFLDLGGLYGHPPTMDIKEKGRRCCPPSHY